MAMMLLNLNATVTICHSRTKNIEKIISEADLIVGAVGIPKFIKTEWIKKGFNSYRRRISSRKMRRY